MFDEIYLLMINKKNNEEVIWDLEIKLVWHKEGEDSHGT